MRRSKRLWPLVVTLADDGDRPTVADLRERLRDLPDSALVEANSCCCGASLTVSLPRYGPDAPPTPSKCRACEGGGLMLRFSGVTTLGVLRARARRRPVEEDCPFCEGAGHVTGRRQPIECKVCEGRGWGLPPGADLGDAPEKCGNCRGGGFLVPPPF
jgi:hypothetical protein